MGQSQSVYSTTVRLILPGNDRIINKDAEKSFDVIHQSMDVADRQMRRLARIRKRKRQRNSMLANNRNKPDQAGWTFFSNHAHVLVCLHRDADCILREVAAKVGITERAVQKIVAELEAAGILKRTRVGRCNHYTISPEKHLRHPIESHRTIGDLMKFVMPD